MKVAKTGMARTRYLKWSSTRVQNRPSSRSVISLLLARGAPCRGRRPPRQLVGVAGDGAAPQADRAARQATTTRSTSSVPTP